jgi:hypothetical protein
VFVIVAPQRPVTCWHGLCDLRWQFWCDIGRCQLAVFQSVSQVASNQPCPPLHQCVQQQGAVPPAGLVPAHCMSLAACLQTWESLPALVSKLGGL